MSEPFILNFGKHRGESITAVPLDYLQWIMNSFKNEKDSWFKQRPNIVRKVQDEIVRRGHVVVNPVAEIEDRPISFDDLGSAKASMKTEPGKAQIHLTDSSVNELSKSVDLLKAFLRRTDQNQGILEWMHDTAKEIIRHGSEHVKPVTANGRDVSRSTLGSLEVAYRKEDQIIWVELIQLA